MYASDLLRAKHTAEIVAKHMGITTNIRTELRERNLGKCVGKSVQWLRENIEVQEKTIDDRMFSDAESRRDEWNRLKPLFGEIMASNDECIIVVSHGDLLSVWNTMFLGMDVETLNRFELFDLYVCIGQSNMAGRATLTPEVMDTLQNVYLLNDKGNFEPAVNPLNRYSTVRKDLSMQRLGPAYGFAKEMARQTKRPVGLVVNARGGSSINSWLKGSKDGYYEEALSRVRIAMKQGGVLKAILWHQGEADCSNPEAYKQKLISLVKDLREDLGMPNLPVVVGQISQWNWTKREAGTVPFNQMIKKVSSFIPYSDWVSSKGLGWYKDEKDPHFNTEAQLLLGKRYAKKILKFYKHQ